MIDGKGRDMGKMWLSDRMLPNPWLKVENSWWNHVMLIQG